MPFPISSPATARPRRNCSRIAREEVHACGVEILRSTVVDASCTDSAVEVQLNNGTVITGRKLLLATGVTDELPAVEGVRELYGTSVFHCPYCDGWGVRDQPLAAYGDADDAIGMALSLLTWSSDVVVCTDGDRADTRRAQAGRGPQSRRSDPRRSCGSRVATAGWSGSFSKAANRWTPRPLLQHRPGPALQPRREAGLPVQPQGAREDRLPRPDRRVQPVPRRRRLRRRAVRDRGRRRGAQRPASQSTASCRKRTVTPT